MKQIGNEHHYTAHNIPILWFPTAVGCQMWPRPSLCPQPSFHHESKKMLHCPLGFTIMLVIGRDLDEVPHVHKVRYFYLGYRVDGSCKKRPTPSLGPPFFVPSQVKVSTVLPPWLQDNVSHQKTQDQVPHLHQVWYFSLITINSALVLQQLLSSENTGRWKTSRVSAKMNSSHRSSLTMGPGTRTPEGKMCVSLSPIRDMIIPQNIVHNSPQL